KALNLVSETSRSRIIIVVPVGDDLPRRVLAAVIPLRANLRPTGEMDQPDSRIALRHQMLYVLSVRQDHQFAAAESLPLKTLYRLRQPRRAIPRQAEARHERCPAEPPPGLRERSLSSRKPVPEGPASSRRHCGATAARRR